jgi:hypothetical protein
LYDKHKTLRPFNTTVQHNVSPQKTVAIFSATGGTGLACLKNALAAGSHFNVLARTPSTLSDLSSQYPDTLHITQGDIRSAASLKSTLLSSSTGQVVDVIISSIGMVLQRKGLSFGSQDPTICEDGTKAILSALSELEAEGKVAKEPSLILLSSTGISDKRDIPVAMIPLYHWMLSVPHKDKKKMEDVMISAEGKRRNWVLVRPSLLVDGEAKGLREVRSSAAVPGVEEKRQESTAIRYTIRRDDVGLWIVEQCVKKDAGEWHGKMVTLTY